MRVSMDFIELIQTTEYDFLRTNEHLGDRIMLLGLGGSHAYGTNNEGSIKPNVLSKYESILDSYKEKMKGYSHREQKPYWHWSF